MIDALILASLPATFAVLLALGALDDRRFRASLAGPRPVPVPRQVELVELPSWAALPGPAAWSAGRDTWPEPPAEPAFELPPPPAARRLPPSTYLAAVSAGWDSYERRTARVVIDLDDRPTAGPPAPLVEPLVLLP